MAFILVIDDEPLLLDLVSTVLRMAGHEITAVADPTLVESTITNALTPVDLLIADVDMRPITGFALVKQLRARHIDCPVIFMSGHQGLNGIVTDSLGHRFMLEKPFTAPELRSAVQRVLGSPNRQDAFAVP